MGTKDPDLVPMPTSVAEDGAWTCDDCGVTNWAKTPFHVKRYFIQWAFQCSVGPRTVGAGSRLGRNRGDSSVWEAGTFNMQPMNLGYLPAFGYAPDRNVHLCPSAENVPAFNTYTDQYYDNRAEYLRMGPMDGRGMTHGDYTWVHSGENPNWWRRARYGVCTPAHSGHGTAPEGHYHMKQVQGHYAYRNAPLLVICWSRKGRERTYGYTMNDYYEVPGTRPVVKSHVGCPMFPTPKNLAGRALASDGFGKQSLWGTYYTLAGTKANGPRSFGEALWHHKAGYNVLYGDYHVAWYGDPMERISSWPVQCHTATGRYYQYPTAWPCSISPQARHPSRFEENLTTHTYHGARLRGGKPNLTVSTAVWHWFDQAAGIDHNTDEDQEFGRFP
jgi:hypothetical protein